MSRRILILLCALGAPACGDAILCDSSPLVVIQSPTAAVEVDGDSVAPGVQTDVRVRSTLFPTDGLELTVFDSAGAQVMTYRGLAGEDGTTLFAGVTLPGPRARLVAIGRNMCGEAQDEIEIEVLAGSGCDLQIAPAPLVVPAYPGGVLNAALDPELPPGFQATLEVATRGGWVVELFANTGEGEQSLGGVTADEAGVARLPQTLADGPVSFRAVCRGAGAVVSSAAASTLVDTTPPACDFTSPAPGSSITPTYDLDGDLDNGIQIEIEALVGGGDVAGEPVQLTITSDEGSTTTPMSPVDAQGKTTAIATIDPQVTPATFQLVLAARDRAANPCASARPYEVVYDGCPIEVVSPTAPVTVDVDGQAGNGSQVDVVVSVGPACEGRTVTGTCGLSSPQGVVPAGGQLTLRADLCGTSPCDAQALCTFRVTSLDGVQTQASAAIAFDDLGPAVSVEVVQPQLSCGGQLAAADDVDPGTAGVQVVARVSAAAATDHALELTNTGGTTTVPAPTDVTITVDPGLNLLIGRALDALGNPGQSATCTIALADLAVGIAPPASSGLLGRKDGTVAGGALTFELCGTVSQAGSAVAVRVDGGPPLPATVNGTDWCRTLTLAEAAHAVVATATKGLQFGNATQPLRVDLTPPDPVTAFAPTAATRQRAGLAWTAPADGAGPVAAYLVKVATTPLTEAGFDTEGEVIARGPPAAPGSPEEAEVFPARIGTSYWIGVASVDAAGNRSAAAIAGPIVPAWGQLGPIGGPNAQQGQISMGAAIAHGKFNDDEFDDLAIAAPTQNAGGLTQAGAVYVYFGGPGGIAATPQLSILGGSVNALTGSGLAAVRWSSATRDDLVIGAPGASGGAGRLYVLAGGASLPTGTIAAGSVPLQLGVSTTAPGWFGNGGLGAAAVAADVDGDGVRDLVASAIRGGGTGGVVIFYGGTITESLQLSDTDTSGFGAAIVEYLPDPLGLAGRGFGTYLHAVGPTRGPLDVDDDLVIAYEDDVFTMGERLYVIRGNGTRPSASLTERSFVIGRDVRIELPTAYLVTELGAQAVAIADHNGDGAADLAISAYRNLNGAGQVIVIDGDTVGVNGVASTTAPGVVLTTIQGTSGMRLGAALAAHDALSDDDVDGDGLDDLLVGAVTGGVAHLYVWFGGTLPLGTTTIATAGASIAGPSVFAFSSARPHGPAGQARWVGDLDGDGLHDVCWASPYDNATGLDGAFAVQLDGAPAGP